MLEIYSIFVNFNQLSPSVKIHRLIRSLLLLGLFHRIFYVITEHCLSIVGLCVSDYIDWKLCGIIVVLVNYSLLHVKIIEYMLY